MRRKHAWTTTSAICWKRRSWRASTCRGVSKDEFLKDRRTQQAVVLNLMTIGEAAARIVNECKEFAAAHPEIPWAQMRGMRNRMVHGYFDVDLNIVWDTVQSSLPELDSQLREVTGSKS